MGGSASRIACRSSRCSFSFAFFSSSAASSACLCSVFLLRPRPFRGACSTILRGVGVTPARDMLNHVIDPNTPKRPFRVKLYTTARAGRPRKMGEEGASCEVGSTRFRLRGAPTQFDYDWESGAVSLSTRDDNRGRTAGRRCGCRLDCARRLHGGQDRAAGRTPHIPC